MPTVDDHLLTMQRRWTTRLSALLDMAIEEGCTADRPMVDLAASARRRLATEQPELRDELDRGRGRAAPRGRPEPRASIAAFGLTRSADGAARPRSPTARKGCGCSTTPSTDGGRG